MKAGLTVCVAAVLSLAAAPVLAQDGANSSGPKPPMNDFYQAFYTCEGGATFMMTYDSDTPQEAKLVTNGDKKAYALKRIAAPAGVQFNGGVARFWTDGKAVKLEGTPNPYKGCRVKGG